MTTQYHDAIGAEAAYDVARSALLRAYSYDSPHIHLYHAEYATAQTALWGALQALTPAERVQGRAEGRAWWLAADRTERS